MCDYVELSDHCKDFGFYFKSVTTEHGIASVYTIYRAILLHFDFVK